MPDTRHKKYYDIAIIGAGAIGLWLANLLSQEDVSVALLDENASRASASHGVLGALLPHMPTGWNAKKQFQFEALTALPGLLSKLEAQSGLQTGYRQCGRIMPIRREGFLRQTRAFGVKYKDVWCKDGQPVASYRHCPTKDFDHWIEAETAPLGLAHETLSARINPRQLVQTLRQNISGRVDMLDHFSFHHFEGNTHTIYGSQGEKIQVGKLAITAGYKSYALLAPFLLSPLLSSPEARLGAGIKGQAALLKTHLSTNALPIIYHDGLYIVPQENGFCAVGSTAEKSWSQANTTDEQINHLITRAKTLCPALETAITMEKWAGIRPRCHAKDPLIGKMPDHPVYVATGGFKITLGIAHKMAESLVEILKGDQGKSPSLPPSFTMDFHLAEAEKRLKQS